MTDDRLFPLDDIPEVPFLRVPRGSRGAAISDERLGHDYPPEWHRCLACRGGGLRLKTVVVGELVAAMVEVATDEKCPVCLGMGSVKARVRLEADHRCVRCGHPYMPKGDAKMLGVEPTPYRWSPCDERCTHGSPTRWRPRTLREAPWAYEEFHHVPGSLSAFDAEAEWRILTVHHLDGDKANLSWWNLAALCQRCHLEIQGRVVMERIYPHEHSAWFRPFVAGYYAKVYLGEDLTREETIARLEELLDLERVAA